MFQTMTECTNTIFSLRASEYKGEPFQSEYLLLEALGQPHTKCKFIHFAGSNGKGSTLNAVRAILIEHGLAVGAFTSPHFERANERITINSEMISDVDFLRIANIVAAAVHQVLGGKFPSFFEFMTVMAFVYFAEQDVDVVLLETGLGGRLDATNVVCPEVSVITTISLEHTELLGHTYAQIAAEKGGILKQSIPAVIGVRQLEAREQLKQIARERQVPLYVLDEQIRIEKAIVQVGERLFSNIYVQMEGAHQFDNAALAIAASSLFAPTLTEETVQRALQKAMWPGRFERILPNVILDGAHNVEGVTALIQTLQEREAHKRVTIVFATMEDKEFAESIALFDRCAETIVFTELAMPRAAKADVLFATSVHPSKQVALDWRTYLLQRVPSLREDELLVVTGSLYFIAEVRRMLKERDV